MGRVSSWSSNKSRDSRTHSRPKMASLPGFAVRPTAASPRFRIAHGVNFSFCLSTSHLDHHLMPSFSTHKYLAKSSVHWDFFVVGSRRPGLLKFVGVVALRYAVSVEPSYHLRSMPYIALNQECCIVLIVVRCNHTPCNLLCRVSAWGAFCIVVHSLQNPCPTHSGGDRVA